MKYDSMGLSFKTKEEQDLASLLYKMVLSIRRDLAVSYNVVRGPYKNYEGLCYTSIEMLERKIKRFNNENNTNIELIKIHGEQAHSKNLISNYWHVQHTWAVVKLNNTKIYVDPTSSQFKDFYPYIPDFYISDKKPKWYYADRDNPRWNNICVRWLNDHIGIKKTLRARNGSKYTVREGIIEYIQYDIYGKLCDMLK